MGLGYHTAPRGERGPGTEAQDPAEYRLDFFTTAAFSALTNGRQLVDDLRSIRTEWTDRIRACSDSGTWKIADLLLRHPVVNAAFLANELGVAPQNTYRSLARLIEAEVVVEFTDRKGNQMWRSPEVLDALDHFAARAAVPHGSLRSPFA